jgi:hypothetical protein
MNIRGERGRDFKQENAKSLTYWLEVNRPSNATDPRDKVFAILGMVDSLDKA